MELSGLLPPLPLYPRERVSRGLDAWARRRIAAVWNGSATRLVTVPIELLATCCRKIWNRRVQKMSSDRYPYAPQSLNITPYETGSQRGTCGVRNDIEIYITKHQRDATSCRFYYCSTLHVSGVMRPSSGV